MDTIDTDALRITMRRYGPTLHLTFAGELDHEAEAPMAQVRTAALTDEVAVVACDLHHVRFMDVSGLRCVLDLQEEARAYGVTVLAYNWRPQPLRLLHLLDGLDPGVDSGLRALRDILREHTEAQLALGVAADGETSALVDADRRSDPGPAPASR